MQRRVQQNQPELARSDPPKRPSTFVVKLYIGELHVICRSNEVEKCQTHPVRFNDWAQETGDFQRKHSWDNNLTFITLLTSSGCGNTIADELRTSMAQE